MSTGSRTHLIIDLIGGLVLVMCPFLAASAGIACLLVPLLQATPWDNSLAWGLWIASVPLCYTTWLILALSYCVIDVQMHHRLLGLRTRRRLSNREHPVRFVQKLSVYSRARLILNLPLVQAFLPMRGWRQLVLLAYSTKTHLSPTSQILGYLFDPDLTHIGDHAVIGSETSVAAHSLTVDPDGSSVLVTAPITIGPRVTIGGDGRVDPGVSIGADALVEPCSYVSAFTEIGRGEVWGGNPARFIRMRSGVDPASSSETSGNAQENTLSSETPMTGAGYREAETLARAIVAKVLEQPVETIASDMHANDCAAWDSLAQLGMALELQQHLNKPLTHQEAFRLRSLRDLRQVLLEQNRSSESPTPEECVADVAE